MSSRDLRGQTDAARTLEVLLRSMSGDAPHPRAKQAMMAALGLGAATATAASSAGALGVVAKFVGLGALTGLVATAVVSGARHGLSPSQPSRAHTTAAVSASAPPKVSRPEARAAAPAPESTAVNADAIDSARSVAVRVAPPVPHATPVAVSEEQSDRPARQVSGAEPGPFVPDYAGKLTAGSRLREETAQLDRARAAIAAGNGAGGLIELERYNASFPHGALEPEATLLRVQALLRSGRRADARALSRAFAASHPESPHLERLQSLLGP